MGRTADRYLIESQSGMMAAYSKKWRIGKYLRLSVDSDYTGSDSIENQRELINEYLEKIDDVDSSIEYIDDGRTGTNFERPSFSKMILDMKQGIINCIIVKDLSRFGREYLEAGNYIEKVFPFMEVRFVSIIDRYDSIDPNCDKELLIISLKNLMHEMYSKDISRKIVSTYQMKQENRIFYRTSSIPYGYKMDKGGTAYVLHEPAAAIVRDIFEKYASGASKYEIGIYLWEKNIATPRQCFVTGNISMAGNGGNKMWHISTLDRMLKNEVYIGNIIRHKSEKRLYEDLKSQKVCPNGWIKLEKVHAPIIDDKLFAIVQSMLQNRKEIFMGYREQSGIISQDTYFEKNTFAGILYCGDCGASMIRTNAYRLKNGRQYGYKEFKCAAHKNIHQLCDAKHIDEKSLFHVIQATICKQIRLLKRWKQLIKGNIHYSFEHRLSDIQKEQRRMENAKILSQQEYMKVFDMFNAQKVSKEEFQLFREKYQRECEKHKQGLSECEKKAEKIIRYQKSYETLILKWLDYEEHQGLSSQMVKTLIERIHIFSGKRIEITLRYQDCFLLIQEYLGVMPK